MSRAAPRDPTKTPSTTRGTATFSIGTALPSAWRSEKRAVWIRVGSRFEAAQSSQDAACDTGSG